jgi:nucleoside-diphosphate-sugar epimerase
VQGTQNVITSARAARVPCIVHCSTEALLAGGDRVVHMADETWPIPPTDGTIYPYSKSKGEAETLLLQSSTPGMHMCMHT